MITTASHMITTASHMITTASHMITTTSHMITTTSHMITTASHMIATTSHMITHSGKRLQYLKPFCSEYFVVLLRIGILSTLVIILDFFNVHMISNVLLSFYHWLSKGAFD